MTIEIGDKVICRPRLPGLDDLDGKEGVIVSRVNKGFYVRFKGIKKDILVGSIELIRKEK